MINKFIEVDQVSSYVVNLFKENQNQVPYLLYHNLHHTQTVVALTSKMASYYLLNDSQTIIVLTAAWFHDCGHLFGPMVGHELRSVLIMRKFMKKINTSEEIIQGIESCILATKLPSDPKTLLEEIICDADLYHFGTKEFFVTDMLVKRELELRSNDLPSDSDENSLKLLQTHKFYTQYCRTALGQSKLENINKLQEKIISKSNHKKVST